MKRKLLTALACSALLMGMAACSSNEKTATESNPKRGTAEIRVKIGYRLTFISNLVFYKIPLFV
ncbi:hypothetical protein [Bacillus mycoides]|uniref:hypothetical protein n=1 Tax=Bacillus mycoides TaxID=1405 RepID=UPI001130BA1A|nr:hypothetical protein [Bacillus mycoides]